MSRLFAVKRVTRHRTLQGRERTLRHHLQTGLAAAIQAGDVYTVYQPKFRMSDDSYNGVEALLRWKHATLGDIDPGSIIEAAEHSGQISSLSLWVLQRAIDDQRVLQVVHADIGFHVNVSGKSLSDDDFIESACAVVASAVGKIGFEITETAFIANAPKALANLHRLVAAGIKLSIDDYGSGYSSLAYLKDLPADELKIDKMFVSGMTKSNRDPLIVRSTIDLAHALGMRVVAEGVESLAALALLRVMGCDTAQGFLISPALRLPDLSAFLCDEGHRSRLAAARVSLTPAEAFWDRSTSGRPAK